MFFYPRPAEFPRIFCRAGIPAGKLLKTHACLLQDTAASGIGPHNVNGRIKLYYSASYGLSLSNREKTGTTVSICLPEKFSGGKKCLLDESQIPLKKNLSNSG